MPPSSASLLVASPPGQEPAPSPHPPPPWRTPGSAARSPRLRSETRGAWRAAGSLGPAPCPRARSRPGGPGRARCPLTFRHVLVDGPLHLREAPLEVVTVTAAACHPYGERDRGQEEKGRKGRSRPCPLPPSPGRVPSAPGSPQRRLPAPAPARLPGPCPACSGGGGSRGGRAAPSLVPHLPWRPVPVRRGRGSRGGRRRAGAGRSRGAERPPREARRGGERRGGPGPFKMAPMAGRPAA